MVKLSVRGLKFEARSVDCNSAVLKWRPVLPALCSTFHDHTRSMKVDAAADLMLCAEINGMCVAAISSRTVLDGTKLSLLSAQHSSADNQPINKLFN
jgi:hypothetical protein